MRPCGAGLRRAHRHPGMRAADGPESACTGGSWLTYAVRAAGRQRCSPWSCFGRFLERARASVSRGTWGNRWQRGPSRRSWPIAALASSRGRTERSTSSTGVPSRTSTPFAGASGCPSRPNPARKVRGLVGFGCCRRIPTRTERGDSERRGSICHASARLARAGDRPLCCGSWPRPPLSAASG